jgi:competence ComEA-like helix-hairpin-helix protein
MSDAETRALGRAAILLLVASTLRWGWREVGSDPVGPDTADALPELLEGSRVAAAEAEERARPLGAGERLDPNRATTVQLDRLPGIGPATADAIVASREQDGPFSRAEEMTRVRGLGPAALGRIRAHLDFSGAPPPGPRGRGPASRPSDHPSPVEATGRRRASESAPVDVNRADEAALVTLPGIGPALARRIVEARRERPFRSLEDLTRVRGIGPATVARLGGRVTVGR